MTKLNNFETGIELDYRDLNTAEALGFTGAPITHEQPYIIPDGEQHLSVLKKVRPLSIA